MNLPAWTWWIFSVSLILLAGFASGLTLGMLSLDELNLNVLIQAGTPKERRRAQKVLPLIRRHHQLLVTLLLTNSLAMEALPICLERVVSETVSFVISVTGVLLIGEIIPQAICSRYGLGIGAASSPIIWFLLVVFFPLNWPIGKLLDLLFGTHNGTYFRRNQLRELFQHQEVNPKVATHGPDTVAHMAVAAGPQGTGLLSQEVDIIHNAMIASSKVAKDAMVPLKQVACIDLAESLDEERVNQLILQGHSRYPVFTQTRQSIVGLIHIKQLLGMDFSTPVPVTSLPLRTIIPRVYDTTPLYDVLNIIQDAAQHFSLVQDDASDRLLGIVTLEDIIEELLGQEIEDEDDAMRVNPLPLYPDAPEHYSGSLDTDIPAGAPVL